jgi:hypothetical protein
VVVSLVTSTNGLWTMVDQSSVPGTFPACTADPVAGDLHHRRDKLMVPDPAIVGAGHGAQLDPSVFRLQRLDQFGSVRQEAMLHIDAR